jgi:hypothetical protein
MDKLITSACQFLFHMLNRKNTCYIPSEKKSILDVFSHLTCHICFQVRRSSCPKTMDPPKYPEKILFCGWRRDIDDMIMV